MGPFKAREAAGFLASALMGEQQDIPSLHLLGGLTGAKSYTFGFCVSPYF